MSVLRFPLPDRQCGIVHVMPGEDGGFDVSHESSSGSSWGGFHSFTRAEDAIGAAYAMARDEYGGCMVSICDDALKAVPVGNYRGDF